MVGIGDISADDKVLASRAEIILEGLEIGSLTTCQRWIAENPEDPAQAVVEDETPELERYRHTIADNALVED